MPTAESHEGSSTCARQMSGFSAEAAAILLAGHFHKATTVSPSIPGPSSRNDAYQVQDLMTGALGGACGWKVGLGKRDPEPYCAPIPLSRLHSTGATYVRRNEVAQVEAELGFRLGRDVPPCEIPRNEADCVKLVDAVVPCIEIVETRLAEPAAGDPLWKLADLQANGGLVVGNPSPWPVQDLSEVRLAIGPTDKEAFNLFAHPFGKPLDLLCWTINHVSQRRGGLKRGDVIITGSYCGVVEIHAPQSFVAAFANFGKVSLEVL